MMTAPTVPLQIPPTVAMPTRHARVVVAPLTFPAQAECRTCPADLATGGLYDHGADIVARRHVQTHPGHTVVVTAASSRVYRTEGHPC